MLSFHNDSKIKEKYLNRVRKHRELDNIIKGIGWENGKGCAVGCTLESYNHSRYPIELGLPVWLARLQDAIFEGLPTYLAKYFPEKLLESIPVGVNLEIVKHQLAIRRMDRLIKMQEELLNNKSLSLDKNIFELVIKSICTIKKLHESVICGNNIDSSELLKAEVEEAARASWSLAREVWAEKSSRSSEESSCPEEESAWSSSWSAARAAAWSAVWSSDESLWSEERAVAWSACESSWAAESAWLAAMASEEKAWPSRAASLSSESEATSARSSESSAWSSADEKERMETSICAWKKESDYLIELLKQCT